MPIKFSGVVATHIITQPEIFRSFLLTLGETQGKIIMPLNPKNFNNLMKIPLINQRKRKGIFGILKVLIVSKNT